MGWIELFWILGMALGAWLCYRSIKQRPELYTKKALWQTFNTLGWLAIGLIVFVTGCIVLLRAG
jgi:hypothetical protein